MSTIPAYDHIVVVVEENHNADEIIGNTSQAPFINQLAQGGAILANMAGEIHPSQPNYFALYAGSTFGTADDASHSEPDPTIATILQAAGKSFMGYVDQPGLSDFNHDPWVSFPEGRTVQTNFDTFPALFPNGDYSSLPSLSFVIPGINNDMHNGTIQQADAWLQANLSQYAAWAATHNSLLIVTWDENDDQSSSGHGEASNQVATIVYGAHVVQGTYGTAYNHYNLLSMIAAAEGVTGPNNAATATPVQVFAGKTIASAVTGTVVLGINDNPLLITASGKVNVTGAGLDGVDGSAGTLWAAQNNGAISSTGGNGVYFAGGGTVTNAAAATISGGVNGVLIAGSGAAGTVVNGGTISGTKDGVFLSSTSVPFVYGRSTGATNSVSNLSGAAISGGTYGVYLRNSGAVSNSGSITGAASNGIVLAAGGTITNAPGGTIAGAASGVLALGGSTTLNNGGSITGGSASGYGVALTAGGTLTNAGTISGRDGVGLRAGGSVSNAATGGITATGPTGVGVYFGAPASLLNDGGVTGAALAVLMSAGGSVTNDAGANLGGSSAGVVVNGAAGTVTNAGAIKASASTGTGLDLEQGGSLTNKAGGSITGGGYGLYVNGAAGTVANAGSVTGTGSIGLYLAAAGSIDNTGTIAGVLAGTFTRGGAATLTNSGTISASGSGGAGADIEAGGTVSNAAGGKITGAGFGLFITAGAGTVTNAGAITGTNSAGVAIAAGGSVTNSAGGTIAGGSAGLAMGGTGATLTNGGTITASSAGGAGVDAESGGSVTNQAGGTIGGALGVFITGGTSTVTNAGTITGSAYAVDFAGSGTNRLVVLPGATFNGAVAGGNGTLELGGTAAGSIGGIGSVAFSGFKTLAVDAGSGWTFSGANTAPTVLNNGTLTVAGSLVATTAVDPASTGLFQLSSGAQFEVAAATGAGTRIKFLGSSMLAVDAVGSFGSQVGTAAYSGPKIQAFAAGDTIDLKNFGAAGALLNYNAASGLLQLTNAAAQAASLAFETSSLGSGGFHVAGDGGSGLLLTHA